MNPLMDALQRAEQARSASKVRGAGGSPGPAVSGSRPLDPVRATRDHVEPGAMFPAARGVDEPSGRNVSARWRLEPIRATRDDVAPEAGVADLDLAAPERAPPVHSGLSGESSGSAGGHADGHEGVGGAADATNVVSNGAAALQSRSFAGKARAGGGVPERPPFVEAAPTLFERRPDAAPRPPMPAEPGRVMVDDAGPAGLRIRQLPPEPSGAGESRPASPRAFDHRTLPRRRGIGRLIGATLSLCTVIGVGTGGGYFVWKTEFVRPVLVQRLPPMPVSAMDLAPVQAANAAMTVAGESAAGAAPGTDMHLAASTPESASTSPKPLSAGRSAPETDATSGAADPPAPAVERAGAELRPAPGAGIEIRKRIRIGPVTASLERAYAALLGGDAESAAEAYRAALGHEPDNRDAFLGLAAVAARAGRWDEAAGHYTRLLASHPADTVARAALIAIAEQDPARGESRLKALLWTRPRAAHLHFNLGNLYAAQSRWAEAQQSYFNAYRFDRRNADYAYNLAISLDHLSQPESALGLYREALVLSRSRPASFEAEAALQRIRDLDAHAGADFTSARPASEAVVTAPARPAP